MSGGDGASKGNGEDLDPGYDGPDSELDDILEGSRLGVIEGVTFDLRHELVPVDEWCTKDLSWELGLLFPSECEPGEERGFPAHHKIPHIKVAPGDSISIERIKSFHTSGDPLSNQLDTEERWAYLVLKRSNGESVEFANAMVFVPRDAIGPDAGYLPYDAVEYNGYLRNRYISSKKVGRRIMRIRRECEPNEPWIRVAFLTFERAVALANDQSRNRFDSSDREELMELSVAMGYSLAQAEMELAIKPLALEGLKAKASRQPAHDARRKAGDPVRAEAKQMIHRNPNTSQGACARHVSRVLNKDERTVNRAIADMFQVQTTNSGAMEKRPKHEFLPKGKTPG
jgi:hypothetical protein